jgi:hypothetical protein
MKGNANQIEVRGNVKLCRASGSLLARVGSLAALCRPSLRPLLSAATAPRKNKESQPPEKTIKSACRRHRDEQGVSARAQRGGLRRTAGMDACEQRWCSQRSSDNRPNVACARRASAATAAAAEGEAAAHACFRGSKVPAYDTPFSFQPAGSPVNHLTGASPASLQYGSQWEECWDSMNRRYFFNNITGVSTWDEPPRIDAPADHYALQQQQATSHDFGGAGGYAQTPSSRGDGAEWAHAASPSDWAGASTERAPGDFSKEERERRARWKERVLRRLQDEKNETLKRMVRTHERAAARNRYIAAPSACPGCAPLYRELHPPLLPHHL